MRLLPALSLLTILLPSNDHEKLWSLTTLPDHLTILMLTTLGSCLTIIVGAIVMFTKDGFENDEQLDIGPF